MIGNEGDKGCSKKIIIEGPQKLNTKESPKRFVFPDVFHEPALTCFSTFKIIFRNGQLEPYTPLTRGQVKLNA